MGSDNFSSTLDLLKGYYVNLYVGDEIIKGKLMEVEKDHIVLEDENQYIFYFSIDKIQAITKNTKQFKAADVTSNYVKTQSLVELLESLKNSWVTILCLNKQQFSGVLGIVDTDFVTLINGEERILVKLTHISNILKGFIKEQKTESNSNDTTANNEQKSDSKSEEKISENKSEKQKNDSKNEKQNLDIPVLTNESKKSSKGYKREKTKKAEKETTTNIINESEKDTRIWSEPIKNTVEKPVAVVASTPKSIQEPKKQNMETKQNEMKQEKPEMKPIIAPETKMQSNEVIQSLNKIEKENIPQPLVVSKEKKVLQKETVRDSKPVKMDTAPQKTVSPRSTQELLTKVKKVKETYETQPLMKIDKSRANPVESKKVEEPPKAQEVGVSRFAGEPTPQRDFDRRSIFSGWPSRKNAPRRF